MNDKSMNENLNNSKQSMEPSKGNNEKELEISLLLALNEYDNSELDCYKYSIDNNINYKKMIGLLLSLESDDYIKVSKKPKNGFVLTEEGVSYLKNGSPEFQLIEKLLNKQENLKLNSYFLQDYNKLGYLNCMKNKWLSIKKTEKKKEPKKNETEKIEANKDGSGSNNADYNIASNSKLDYNNSNSNSKSDNNFNSNSKQQKKPKKEINYDEENVVLNISLINEAIDSIKNQLSIINDQSNNDDGDDKVETKIDKKELKLLTKRKLIKSISMTLFFISKGDNFRLERKKLEAELSKELLENDLYKNVQFKRYNFNATGSNLLQGHLHPLLQVRNEFRKILIGMGFEEMPTNKWVESSFWNFDSLFQPQQHAARDMHDTFFLKNPAKATLKKVDPEYISKVQQTHEHGCTFGSRGYRSNWNLEEAQKNILRTHTTAVSAQMLYKLANQKEGFKPTKFFSIDRVFRNESIDKTHLAEFHQVEGLVADYDLTLGDLIGTIRTFFKQVGITNIRFKAAYNPYTEPSMEIFSYIEQLNTWSEIGNSGIFRPEMLLPMGLPKDVKVIAWGLSLERPTMQMTKETHIRNLFGSSVSFDLIKTFPFIRFEQQELEQDKEQTKKEEEDLLKD